MKGTVKMLTAPISTTLRSRQQRHAFTLIELLLVMVILAILAAIVVPKFTGLGAKANIQAAQAQISNFKTALDAYEVANGSYPTTEQGLQALISNPDPGTLKNWTQLLSEGKVPPDPWGTAYVYRSPGTNGKSFDLYSCGPDKQDGTSDDIGND
jgi:general secretion pathway protein G